MLTKKSIPKWQLKIMRSAGEMSNSQMFDRILELADGGELLGLVGHAKRYAWELDFLVKTFREQVLKVKK